MRSGVTRLSQGSSPSSRSWARSSPRIQFAAAFGSTCGRDLLEAGRQLRRLGQHLGVLEGEAQIAHPAPAQVDRQLGKPGADLLHPGPVGHHRHQVGLGEVAVVVRLLLAAQGVELAACRGRSGASPGSPSPPLSRSAVWRAISASMPRSRKRKLFMFLSSVLVPSSVDAGRAHADVGVGAQRALLHVAVAHAEAAQGGAQLAQEGAGLARSCGSPARSRSRAAACRPG